VEPRWGIEFQEFPASPPSLLGLELGLGLFKKR